MFRCICRFVIFAFVLALGLIVAPGTVAQTNSVTSVDTLPFYQGGTYLEQVPTPEQGIGRPIGLKAVRYWELIPYLKQLAASSERVVMEQHGTSHEGRALYNMYVSSPENIARLDEIKATIANEDAGGKNGAYGVPAVAWLGFSIHGDELSGVDASVQLAYQLAAGTDEATRRILDNVIVIIDPNQNPDGRDRFQSMLETRGSLTPNYDHSAMQHQGVWPYGRSNHYWFDLNRDWALATQPETIGRLRTILDWHPQLVIDAHEMGSNATFMSDPPREPINYNTPDNVRKWWTVFDRDHAAAFDQRGWPYYVEEWHDQWYIGYGSAWSTFSGSIGMLYEQARVDGVAIRQRDGYLLTFHEAINHQLQSALANLTTLADNADEIKQDYYDTRREIVAKGRKSGLTFFIKPDGNSDKLLRFFTTLNRQGITVERATTDFKVTKATNLIGEKSNNATFPKGTFIVRTDQPMGGLAKALMEFDAHLDLDFLTEERRELEQFGETRMYEISAWCLPMAFDLDAWQTTSSFNVPTATVAVSDFETEGTLQNPDAQFGFVVNMQGERTRRLLTEFFERDLTIFAAEKAFTLEGNTYRPGSLVLRKRGNDKTLPATLDSLAREYSIDIIGVNTAASTEGSYLGAGTFRKLTVPRIGLLAGNGMNYGSSGVLWFALDQELQQPHTLIDAAQFHSMDLRKFNTLVIPSDWGGSLGKLLGNHGKDRLRNWVQQGGTLVCCDGAAVWAVDSANALSDVRLRRHSLDKLDEYEQKLTRELSARHAEVDTMALWHPERVKPVKAEEEKENGAGTPAKIDEDVEKWARRFRPRGTFLRAQVDTEDWLAFGMRENLPVLTMSRYAFLATDPVQTTARYATDPNDLRLSGLLWPEARERWAGTVVATHESLGLGQIVLFSVTPHFRAYNWGTRAMFANAVLYGPGMGARPADY